MEGKDVGAFWQFHDDGIVHAIGIVIFRELCAQAAGLDADHGVDLGIEVRGTCKNFSSNLIFLDRHARVIENMFGKIAQEFAEGFGAVKDVVGDELFDLLEIGFAIAHEMAPVT